MIWLIVTVKIQVVFSKLIKLSLKKKKSTSTEEFHTTQEQIPREQCLHTCRGGNKKKAFSSDLGHQIFPAREQNNHSNQKVHYLMHYQYHVAFLPLKLEFTFGHIVPGL